MIVHISGKGLQRRIAQFLRGEEEGAALTEFVLTLPVFIIIMAGIITLGQLGASSVGVKNVAYAAMWSDAHRGTTDDWKAMTPRSKLDNPLKQVLGQVFGSAVEGFVNGLPGNIEVNIPGANGADGADGAIGLGGHWGEAEYYGSFGAVVSQGEVDHRAQNHRLAQIDRSPGGSTMQILGHGLDGSNKPRLALDDNLMANRTFNDFELSDMWAEPTSLNDFIKKAKAMAAGEASNLFYDLIAGSGFAPGLMAGTRYGRGVGSAVNEVEVNAFGKYTATHQALYMTALSPNTGGALNTEKLHWLFYVGGTQLNHNQRNILNLLSQNLKTSDMTAAEPYWD